MCWKLDWRERLWCWPLLGNSPAVGEDAGLREKEWLLIEGRERVGGAPEFEDEVEGGTGEAEVDIDEPGPVTRMFGLLLFISSRSCGNGIGTE